MTPLLIAAGIVNTLPQVLEILLATPGIAGISDPDGRLPLHIALTSGRTWNNGVALIAKAEPSAVETCDSKMSMYPFMLAAIPTYSWDNTSIDTIHTLLRNAPNVMQTFRPSILDKKA
jgi:hypothetical protein